MEKRLTIILFAVLTATFTAWAQNYEANWDSIDTRPVPSWFEDAKFGIFIHWGVYSVPAYSPTSRDKVSVYERYAEHYWNRLEGDNISTRQFFTEFHNKVYGPNVKYRDLAPLFKAEMFDPDAWAEIFEDSGAKYVVLTSKHHEGFCLWPSQYSRAWNSVDIGAHRDLLGDLSKSVKSKGLKMGYYYSLLEWFHPLYKAETLDRFIDEHEIPQMKELVENYSPDLLFTDGEWDFSSEKWRSVEFLQWLFNESKVRDSIVVNDRWGRETRSRHGGYYTTEYDLIDSGNASGTVFQHPWEECRGIGGSFGWNRNEYLDEYSTSKQLVDILINKVARGGNLLLDIGPTADGRVPVIMQQRLRDMGDWLRVNGEAIYGSRKWENAPAIDANTTTFFTKGQDAVYVIFTQWPEKPVKIAGIKAAKNVSLLGSDQKVRMKKSGDGITIYPIAFTSPSALPCQHAWVYKIEL